MANRHIPGVSLHWPAENKAQILANAGPRIVERWRAAHKANGWRDIGYHYIVHRNEKGQWQTYDGRSDSIPGAHSGTNAGNEFLGINVAYGMDEKLPEQAFEVLAQLIADLSKAYGFPINRSTVRGHREFIPTQCPGEPLFNRLNDLCQLANRLRAGAPVPQAPKPAPLPDEQIRPVRIVKDGKELNGVLINSQAFVSVYELGKPRWDAQTRTVTIE